MEAHQKYLKNICRVCGKKIITRRGYQTPKSCSDYSETLQTYLGILPSEDEKVYPKNLCSSCKNRMHFIEQNGKDYVNPSKTALFEPHEEQNCIVCINFQKKPRHRSSFTKKKLDLKLSNIGYLNVSNNEENRTFVCLKCESDKPYIAACLTIKDDWTWDFSVFGKNVNIKLFDCGAPQFITEENIDNFCDLLEKVQICPGNQDFADVIDYRIDFKEPFPDSESSGRIAWAESSNGHTPFIKDEFDIIRSSACLYVNFDDVDICKNCKSLRKNLFKYRQRISDNRKKLEERVDPSSTTNIKNLKILEMETRLKNLQISKRQALNQLANASHKIDRLLKKQGIDATKLPNCQHNLFSEICKKDNPFEEGTPQWLLWSQQAEQASKSDSRGMRWHPLIIRWCLSIYAVSPAAYKHISSKQNKFLVLPHVNTLKEFINFTTPSSGFNIDILSKIVTDINMSQLKDYQKNVCLSFDEIKIKSGLVYKRGTGRIIGFTEMGELNEEFRLLDEKNKGDETEDIATYVIVFMVRGLFSSLCEPIGYFASTGFCGDELWSIVLEATRILEALSFKVRCWTCDGASPNRKFYHIMSQGNRFYYTRNIFCPDRNIYFISDPPHLLKTLRNNLENSYGNRKTRTLMLNDMAISWMHVVDVYEWDLGFNRISPGLRMLHKVKEEHIRLTPQHRMSVKYAAQVISASMAKALQMQNRAETKETIRFIQLFDRAFDCLNVSKIKGESKPDRKPYFKSDDSRFEFLKSVLQYLEEWEEQTANIEGISDDDKARFKPSHQTIFGWKMTISSFIELGKQLLNESGDGTFLLSEKFSQDPLEEHFSRHRRIAGCSDNPTLAQFEQQEIALHSMSSNLISDLRGNTSGRQKDRVQLSVDDIRLPKKRGHSKISDQ